MMSGIELFNRNSTTFAFTELQGTNAHMAFELAGERAVVVESAIESDFGDPLASKPQLISCYEYAQTDNVFPRGDTEALLEKAFHLPLGNPGLFG